jgi:hypothetical protein
LSKFQDLEEVSDKMREVYERENNAMNDALACYEFAHDMRPGDLVFAKRGRSRIVGYGTVLASIDTIQLARTISTPGAFAGTAEASGRVTKCSP